MTTITDFQNRLEELLRERGYNHYKLSQLMGVDQKSVDRIFQRDSYPKIETLIEICEVLDITLGDFFSYDTTVDYGVRLTPGDIDLIHIRHKLGSPQRDRLKAYADGLIDGK